MKKFGINENPPTNITVKAKTPKNNDSLLKKRNLLFDSKILIMNNFFDDIIAKLKKEIEIEKIEIVDNSHKHAKHKSFSPDKFHLHLKIRSLYLNSLSRVTAQKEVMRVLKDELSNKIHALEISIEQ